MTKLVDGLYHRRRGAQLLDGVLDPDGWVHDGEGRRWRPPNISSLTRARTRLGADPLHMLFDSVAGPVGADGAAGVFCCGLRVVSMDGSTTDVPNSKINGEYFGRPTNAIRAGRFPQVRWVVAAESGTGALVGATLGPYAVGEQTLAKDLLPAFTSQMMVLDDRNFLSHALARTVLAPGRTSCGGPRRRFRLTPVEVLADGTYLAVLTPPRKADGPPITVRVIEYTVHTGGPDALEDSAEVFALVTDLLVVEDHPALELACAYPMRWECETVIGHHKTDMGAGLAVLRSKDPEGVAQEMWALFAVYQAIHTLIGAAINVSGIPPDKISFPHVLAAATDSVTAGFPRHHADLAFATFLLKILDPRFRVRVRPDRTSPRATKKAGKFPARRDQPAVVRVTHRLQIHCLKPAPEP